MSLLAPEVIKVYNWASTLSTEVSEDDKFYQTNFFKLLDFKIKNTERGLIAISGLQGTGKTKLLKELQYNEEGEKVGAYLKWTRDWKKELFNLNLSTYYGLLRREHNALPHRILELSAGVKRNISVEEMEKDFGKAKCNALKEAALEEFMGSVSRWLIDMPDYSKSNMSLMNSDIDELQAFWDLARGGEYPHKCHVIITVQKELVMKNPHFFWGKCDITTLEPLTIDELVDAYKFITKDNMVFTDEALRLLAQLSRGVFRRFKKYVRITIEKNPVQPQPLTHNHVNEAVTEKQLFEDMELELYDIFKDVEKRKQAVSILNFLRGNANVNLKAIAENIDLSKFTVEKIIPKLNLYGYVKIKRGLGKEALVSLKL